MSVVRLALPCRVVRRSHTRRNRKYFRLDDCSRLREIIELFPTDRHFNPSVVFIVWGDKSQGKIELELDAMVRVFYCSNARCIQSFADTKIRGEERRPVTWSLLLIFYSERSR